MAQPTVWEYKVLITSQQNAELDSKLDELGLENWELILFIPGGHWTWVFKREVQ